MKPTSIYPVLAQRALTALVMAVFAASGLIALDAITTASDVTRRTLSQRLGHFDIACSDVEVSSSSQTGSFPALFESLSEDGDQARISVVSRLPVPPKVVVRNESCYSVDVDRIIAVPMPDHLIVLPGTPPPASA